MNNPHVLRLPIIWALLCMALMGLATGLQAADKGDDAWKINMKEADIKAFISQVSDITQKSFVIDQRVKGNVTVISQAAMSRDEVYEMFLAVLKVHNFAAVESGPVVKVIPAQYAKQDSVPVSDNPASSEQVITQVIPVENTAAVELVPILRPLVPTHGHLAAVPSANALIISDHAANIQRMLKIVKRIDGAESEELEVVELEHAWVGNVVDLLKDLTPIQTGKKGGSGGGRVKVVAEERTNRLIIKGEKSARARIRSLVAELDRPGKGGGGTHVIYLRHADAEKVAEILKGIVSSKTQKTTTKGKKAPQQEDVVFNVQADESLNALVVRAGPSDMTEIRSIVKQLDVRRAQVLIEAAIVEISGDANKALGFQWGFGNEEDGVAGINLSTPGALNLNQVLSAVASDGGSDIGLAEGITLGGGVRGDGEGGARGAVEYGVLIQALSTASNANLLSTPSIMTLDNEEASIVVGENVPFITGSTSGANNDNPFTTVEREDVGITLKVTPQINDGDVVRMVVEQEVSNVNLSSTASAVDLVTSKRSIKTTILANDKETIVLGGLVEDTVEDSVSKVPLLGDIPLLGRLFRAESQSHDKKNLLVFLKPSIVRDAKTAREVSEAKYSGILELQFEMDENGELTRSGRDFPSTMGQVFTKGRVDLEAEEKIKAYLEEASEDASDSSSE